MIKTFALVRASGSRGALQAWSAAIIVLVCMSAAMVARAQPAGAAPQQSSGLDWDRHPVASDFLRNYPPEARRKSISGQAVIHCDVTTAGKLSGCVVVSESPDGMGFGAASLRLAPKFKVRAHDRQSTAGGKVDIPLTWRTMR